MKRRFKTLFLTGVLVASIAVPAFAYSQEWYCNYGCNGLQYGHTVGKNKVYQSGTTTGFSWVDTSSDEGKVYTECTVGGNSKLAPGYGFAQTDYVYYGGDREVYQSHGRY